jgi:hypothetical protein
LFEPAVQERDCLRGQPRRMRVATLMRHEPKTIEHVPRGQVAISAARKRPDHGGGASDSVSRSR